MQAFAGRRIRRGDKKVRGKVGGSRGRRVRQWAVDFLVCAIPLARVGCQYSTLTGHSQRSERSPACRFRPGKKGLVHRDLADWPMPADWLIWPRFGGLERGRTRFGATGRPRISSSAVPCVIVSSSGRASGGRWGVVSILEPRA